jgi:hypothetical protein
MTVHKRVSYGRGGFPFAGDIAGRIIIGKSLEGFVLLLDLFW